jgi:S1-C subfamily serine protease
VVRGFGRRLSTRVLLVVSCCASATAGQGFERAMEAASTKVVRLFGLKAGLSAGYGSGVLVSDDGLVVTVLSLILDARNLRAVTHDGAVYGADVIARDRDRQLALIRLKSLPSFDRRGNRVDGAPVGPGAFDYFEPGDSQSLYPGDWVIAAANPFKVAQGNESISYSVGVFSVRTSLDARRKRQDFPFRGEVLAIDSITSNPGSPGGALLNIDGEWIGLLGRIVVSQRTHTNFNYALPVETVMAFVRGVLDPESAVADPSAMKNLAYSGLKLFELGYRKKLVYVDKVRRGSPAKRAGIRKDDLIVSVGGKSVTDVGGFDEIMSRKQPGERVDFVLIRDDEVLSVVLELEAKP